MKKDIILLIPDSSAGLPATVVAPDPYADMTADQLRDRLRKVEAKLAAYESAASQLSAEERLIRQKQSVGLTRQQAISVIKTQNAFDEAHAAPSSARKL